MATKRDYILGFFFVIATAFGITAFTTWVFYGKARLSMSVLQAVNFGVLYLIGARLALRQKNQISKSDPARDPVSRHLTSLGFPSVVISYFSEDSKFDYSIPKAYGRSLSISHRAKAGLTSEALLWSATTEYVSHRKVEPPALAIVGTSFLVALVFMGLTRTGLLESVRLSIGMALIFGSIFVALVVEYRIRLKVDADLTKSEADRLAAQEALRSC